MLCVLRPARKAHERKPEDKLRGSLPQFPYKGALPAVGDEQNKFFPAAAGSAIAVEIYFEEVYV